MKKRGIFIISLLILLSGILTANVVFDALTGSKLFSLSKNMPAKVGDSENILPINIDSCSPKAKINLKGATEEHLVQLSKYQDICNSQVTDTLMVFTDMPKDDIVAKDSAAKMAEKLKLFHERGIRPIVIVEPVTAWGLTDFTEFRSGFYDSWIETYFRKLKAAGVTDEMMGTWVPFPEANLPYWNHTNTTPEDFSAIVNKYLGILKKHFPGAKGSILLNSATYESDDFEWANGEYVSLRQYVVGLNKNLIDSVGMQGFPWISAQGSAPSSVFDPAEFLNYQLIEEMAQVVDTKDVWLNTGTFGAKYTIDSQSTVHISAEKRVDLLGAILSEAIKLRNKGFVVTINIFAQDKSDQPEATDWSYLSESFSGSANHEKAFVQFMAKANSNTIAIGLFDRLDN